jgi:hypothetical protein
MSDRIRITAQQGIKGPTEEPPTIENMQNGRRSDVIT